MKCHRRGYVRIALGLQKREKLLLPGSGSGGWGGTAEIVQWTLGSRKSKPAGRGLERQVFGIWRCWMRCATSGSLFTQMRLSIHWVRPGLAHFMEFTVYHRR